jgi:hypothetical protein
MVKIPKIHSTKHGFIILIFFFILSRIFYYLIGIRFDITPLYWFYQFIDPQLLKFELFKSILYLHTQPPVFNLCLGLILKISNNHEVLAFTLIYQIIGLLLVLNLYILMRKLNISLFLALAIAIFFTISPPVIFFENWLFYTYPITFLVLISTVVLHSYIERQRTSNLLLFFSISALVVLTRSLFQPLWFITILIGLAIYDRGNLKRIFLCALFPLLLIGIVHFKNYVIFKQTNLSSWLGMNLAKMTMTIPLEKIESQTATGRISGISAILPFQGPEKYREFANFDTLINIHVLDQKYKSSGFLNFNHIGYIGVSRQYLEDAKYLIKKYPQYYALSVCKAFYAYLRPCSDSMIIRNYNRWVIKDWVDIYENYCVGDVLARVWQTRFTNRYGEERKVHLNFLYIFVPALLIWGLITIIKGKDFFNYQKAQLITISYAMFNIVYVTLAGNLFEVSENMRFRFLIVPLLYVFLAIWFKYLFNRNKRT